MTDEQRDDTAHPDEPTTERLDQRPGEDRSPIERGDAFDPADKPQPAEGGRDEIAESLRRADERSGGSGRPSGPG